MFMQQENKTKYKLVQNDLAPVLLIAYNRPDHFRKALIALRKNTISIYTDLHVAIDGPKNNEDKLKQKLILETIEENINYFKEIKIHKSKINKGLKKNIVESITNMFKYYDKIIVLEDDLITAKNFLSYMNEALKFYEKKTKIWHIAGKNEVNFKDKKNETFLWRFMHCSGWATWKNRWFFFNSDASLLIKKFKNKNINKFNLDGIKNSWEQLENNANGKINTWAILWYATIFLNNGLCLSPWFSYVKNIGSDGSGAHDSKTLGYLESQPLNHDGVFSAPKEFVESKSALRIMKQAYKAKPGLIKFFIKITQMFISNSNYEKLKNSYYKVYRLF